MDLIFIYLTWTGHWTRRNIESRGGRRGRKRKGKRDEIEGRVFNQRPKITYEHQFFKGKKMLYKCNADPQHYLAD